MRGSSSEITLALVTATLGVALGGLGAVLVGASFERRIEAVAGAELSRARDAFRSEQASEVEKLSTTLDALMASRELRDAFRRRDRPTLLATAAPTFEVLRERDRITHWYFIEPAPSRQVFLRVHRPELLGDRVGRATLTRAIDSGEQGAGLELGRTAFALRVVRPWVVDGQLLGYMELAEEVNHFLRTMKARTGDAYGLLVDRRLIDEAAWARVLDPEVRDWNGRPDVLLVDATDPLPGIAGPQALDAVPDGGRLLDEVEDGDRTLLRGLFPVRDATGRKVGALFVVHDFTATHRAAHAGRTSALALLLSLSVGGAGLGALAAHLLVFRPLTRLRRRLERRAAGGSPPGPPATPEGHDDLGRLEDLVARAIDGAAGAPAPPPVAPVRRADG